MNDNANIYYFWGAAVEEILLILIWIFEMLKEKHFKLTVGQVAIFLVLPAFSWFAVIFTFGIPVSSCIDLVMTYFDKPIIESKNKKEES